MSLLDRVDFVLPTIAIGNYPQACDPEVHDRYGFRSILNLSRHANCVVREGSCVAQVERLPLHDGAGNSLATFERAVRLLSELNKESSPVLVHCNAGTSRSPAVVAGLLVREHGLSADEALAFVAAHRYTQVNRALQHLLAIFAQDRR